MDVLTHGLTARPLSTAFLASSAAPSITEGFEVLVHDVIEEITTAPWSSSKDVPSAVVTRVGFVGRPVAPAAAETAVRGFPPSPLPCALGLAGSLAGNVSSTDSSTEETAPAAASGSSAPWST